MKRPPLRRGDARLLRYPFALLTQSQRTFLHALARSDILTIGQAFRSAGIKRCARHAMIESWLDDPAFQDGLFTALRTMPRVRREQVLDTICLFVQKQPIRRICDIPKKPFKSPTGWHRNQHRTSPRRTSRRPSSTFSESGEDPWK
jgi:hypothetical protein